MIDEEGYLAVVHCVLALEPVREMLATHSFTPTSDLCTGQQVPELDFKLTFLADSSSEGPSSLIKTFVNEMLSFASSHTPKVHLFHQFLTSQEIPHLDFSQFEPNKITITDIQWEDISMKLSLKILSCMKADAFIFTNGLYYTALTRNNNQSWVIFDSNATNTLSFPQAVKSMIIRNMYPKFAFNSSGKSVPDLSGIHKIANGIDNIIQFKLAGQKSKDKLPPRASWKCKQCANSVSHTSYECNLCRSINWDKFYQIKGGNCRQEKPYIMKKNFSDKEIRNKTREIPEKATVSPQTNLNHIARKNSCQGLYQNSYLYQNMYANSSLSAYPKTSQMKNTSKIACTDTFENKYTRPSENTHVRPSEITYARPSENTYANSSVNTYARPSENTYTRPSENTYTRPSENTYASVYENTHAKPSENMYANAYENTYTRPSENTYARPSVNAYINVFDNTHAKTSEKTSENTYTKTSENTYTKTSENTYTKTSENTYASTSDFTDTNPSENAHAKLSENTHAKLSENTYTKPSENTYIKPSENAYAKPSENAYAKPSENAYAKPSENTYTKPSENSYANDLKNTSENPHNNSCQKLHQNLNSYLRRYSYKDSDHLRRRNSAHYERSDSPKFRTDYRPSNECSTCHGLYDFKCLSCTKNETRGDGTCKACGSPNFSYSKNCWKCGNSLQPEIKRRMKREFTFGKEI